MLITSLPAENQYKHTQIWIKFPDWPVHCKLSTLWKQNLCETDWVKYLWPEMLTANFAMENFFQNWK